MNPKTARYLQLTRHFTFDYKVEVEKIWNPYEYQTNDIEEYGVEVCTSEITENIFDYLLYFSRELLVNSVKYEKGQPVQFKVSNFLDFGEEFTDILFGGNRPFITVRKELDGEIIVDVNLDVMFLYQMFISRIESETEHNFIKFIFDYEHEIQEFADCKPTDDLYKKLIQ